MKYPDPKIVETDWYTTAEVNGNYVRVRIEAFVNRDGDTKEYQTKLKKLWSLPRTRHTSRYGNTRTAKRREQ